MLIDFRQVRNILLRKIVVSIAEFWFALSSTAQGDQSSSLLSTTNSNNQPQPYITDTTQETTTKVFNKKILSIFFLYTNFFPQTTSK